MQPERPPPEETPALTERAVFVGRQPIFDQQLAVVAYELLFRDGSQEHRASGPGDVEATACVLANTLLEIGLEAMVENKRAFVNFSRDFLLEDLTRVFPPDQIVLEILEDSVVDERLLAALQDLSSCGYTIALDDFVYRQDLLPLVELADIIKLDLSLLDRSSLPQHVARLRRHEVQLVAEKIETHEQFEYCQQLGFDYFQGYFLCRPNTVRGQRSLTNRLAILELVAKLMNPAVEFNELEYLISRDASLSYKLVQLCNTALFRRAVELTTIRQALRHLGTDKIAAWATLLLLTRVDDKPSYLLTTALTRANMCERLSLTMAPSNKKTFYLVGLFSVLDALLDIAMPELLESLPLAADIKDALVFRRGVLGEVLRCVENYERGNWDEMGRLDVTPTLTTQAYLAAIAGSRQISTLGHV